MKIVLYIVIGLVVLSLLAKIFGAVHSAAERAAQKRRDKRNRKRNEKKWRREERKKEAEADKLVPKFMRSDLTKAIIKTAKAKTGVGETVAEIGLYDDGCRLRIATGVVNNKLQYKEVYVTYRELGFQPLNNEIEQAALAKAVAQIMGTDYEWNGFYYVGYKHMDKLEPKLRSAI